MRLGRSPKAQRFFRGFDAEHGTATVGTTSNLFNFEAEGPPVMLHWALILSRIASRRPRGVSWFRRTCRLGSPLREEKKILSCIFYGAVRSQPRLLHGPTGGPLVFLAVQGLAIGFECWLGEGALWLPWAYGLANGRTSG